ncbi:unnamed protein product [Lampetra fluviatilis]
MPHGVDRPKDEEQSARKGVKSVSVLGNPIRDLELLAGRSGVRGRDSALEFGAGGGLGPFAAAAVAAAARRRRRGEHRDDRGTDPRAGPRQGNPRELRREGARAPEGEGARGTARGGAIGAACKAPPRLAREGACSEGVAVWEG